MPTVTTSQGTQFWTGGHLAHDEVANRTLTDQKRQAQNIAACVDETFAREFAVGAYTVSFGTLHLIGHVLLRSEKPVTSLSTRTSTTLVTTPTHQWMCLVNVADLSVLCKTEDKTTEAWAANTKKSFTVTGGPFVPTQQTLAFLGVVMTGTTAGTIRCTATGDSGLYGETPIKAGTSTTGLTDPASLGATAGAITPIAQLGYGWYS